MNKSPIGIIDSGSGGLSVWKVLQNELHNESFLYLGDHQHLPYSEKSTEYIRSRVSVLINFLLKKQIKSVVIACNTATVAGIDFYRLQFPNIPILGVVPVIKTAVEVTQKRKILVLSTPFTASSSYQKKLIETFASTCEVFNVGCPRLVTLIESGIVTGPEIRKELESHITTYLEKGIDVIALGCTHFPFLIHEIHKIIENDDVQILDSAAAVARQLNRVLVHNKIESKSVIQKNEFYTTGDDKKVTLIAQKLLSQKVNFIHVNI